MKIKKVIVVSLFIILLASSILAVFSCSKKDGENITNQTTATQQNVADTSSGTTENPRLAIKEEIPDLNYNDKNFNIMYPIWSMYNDYYFAEEINGERINDAIYDRTRNVEDRLKIKFVESPVAFDDVGKNLKKSVGAGSDDYQMVLTHCINGLPAIITGSLVQDWNKMPIVDFSKPWWNQRMNETMSIDGHLFTAVSDYIIFDPNVIYFNKDMIKSLGLETPYNLVNDGKWTWTKLAEMSRQASADLDGDGQYTETDQYGFVTHMNWMLESTVHSSGMYTTVVGDDGYLKYNLKNERFGTLVTTMYDLLYNGNQTYIGTWDPNNYVSGYESQVPLSTGRALFHMDPLSAGKRYRAYEVDFGILPYPKLDEEQKEYLSLSWNGFMVIPATTDAEMAGAVCEALAAESYRLTVPAYYDIILTSKIARDIESTAMIDLIYKGACYDFGLNFSNFDALTFPIENILSKKNTDYISFMEKSQNQFEKKLADIYDKVRANFE